MECAYVLRGLLLNIRWGCNYINYLIKFDEIWSMG